MGTHVDLGPGSVPGTLRSADQLQTNPVIAILDNIPQQGWRGVDVVNYYVDMAVVEQVSESGPAPRNYISQTTAGSRRDFLELHAIQIRK